MSDTTNLLVPIQLKALLVNQQVANGTVFSRWQSHYENLINNMQSPIPQPFQEQGQNISQGFHLHWELPYALTHGKSDDQLFIVTSNVTDIVASLGKGVIPSDLSALFAANYRALSSNGILVSALKDSNQQSWTVSDWEKGHSFSIRIKIDASGAEYLSVANNNIDFPLAPNRWLIVRFQPGMNLVAPKSWIVQSDFMNATTGTVSFLNPSADNLGSSNVITKIGKSEVLTANWTEPDANGNLFLKAVGPGDVTFSSYAPATENVYSFVDTDVTNLPEGTALSYFVCGWYSNEKFDPLYNPLQQEFSADFIAQMDALSWSIAGCEKLADYTGPIPARTFYHAMVHSLSWQTKTMPSGQNTQLPQDIAKSVKLAIGNTSVEALSALVQATAGEEDVDVTLLEAFQYGVLDSLDKVGGTTLVHDKMLEAQFGNMEGGILWDIVGKNHNATAPSDTQAPDISDYADKLAALNQRQKALDENKRTLASKQWTLYARWWKNQNYNVLGLGPTNPPDDMADIASALENTSTDYSTLVTSIKQLQNNISQAYISNTVPLFTDQQAIELYASNVLALDANLILKPSNMPRYWHPNEPVMLVSGVANSVNDAHTASLPCRTAKQLIDGLKIDQITVTAAQAAAFIPLPVVNNNISDVIYALCKESWFLDPVNAPNIAKNPFHGNVSTADIATAIQNGSWAQSSSYAPVATSVALWQQPWNPLFLEWKVQWFPTYSQKDENSPWLFARDEWIFDGDRYNWSGTKLKQSIVMGYSGRTILSSNAVLNFETRLRDYINKSKKPQEKLTRLDDLLTQIKGWGMLSQRLSGLYDQFTTRSIEQSWPPVGDIASLVESQYRTTPDPSKGDKDFDYGPVSPSFFPQMGGFFVIDDIRIVDMFGQCISLLSANNNPTGGKASAFAPIRSKQLTPANQNMAVGDYTFAQFVQQPLRLCQPCQLKMRWVDSANDSQEVGLEANANPVCGWILPNHLDSGLSIYDQTGLLLGEVREDINTGVASWYPAPDSKTPITDPADIENVHLRGVITGLLAAEQTTKTAMDNFTKVIDETLWLIAPLGGRADQDMSVLIGRPLAVLRLELGLALEGDPLCDQSWGNTFKQDDNGVTKTAFDLRLGSLEQREDGLLGYYSDDYQTFNSVHYPDGLDAGGGYIKQIGGNARNYLSLVPNAAGKYVTLIMDPRGSLHGSTGILPVKEIVLPNRFVASVLKQMEVTFSVGSLLTSTEAIQIPRLSEQNGNWSWIAHTSFTDYEIKSIEFTSPKAKLSTPSVEIVDGWLKLVANQQKGAE